MKAGEPPGYGEIYHGPRGDSLFASQLLEVSSLDLMGICMFPESQESIKVRTHLWLLIKHTPLCNILSSLSSELFLFIGLVHLDTYE